MSEIEGAFRGRLKALGLADILEFMRGLNRKGLLMVTTEGTAIGLYLRAGRIVHATSSRPGDRLGEFLLRWGLISRSEHDQAVREASQGQRLGKSLVACGALTPRALMEARHRQVREIALSVFEWDTGEYTFLEDEEPGEEGIMVDLPILDLVVEGIRSVRRLSLFRERLPSPDWVFEPMQVSDPSLVALEPHEEYVLSLVDGHRTLGAIVELSEFGDLETLRILFLFSIIGRLKTQAQEAPRGGAEAADGGDLEEIAGHYNRMLGQVFQHLMREIGPIAEDLLAKSLREMKTAHHVLLGRVVLGGDGTLDLALLRENLRSLPADSRRAALVQGLNELLYAELLALRMTLGAESERRVLRTIRGPFAATAAMAGLAV